MNHYMTADDVLWFVGTVRNTGAVAVDSIRSDVILTDEAGGIVAESFSFTD